LEVPVILASASPRRRELLEELGIVPTIMTQDVDETPLDGEAPTHLVERLAMLKADACAANLSGEQMGETVLAADTIVWSDDGDVLGKPSCPQEARETLRKLSGKTHHVSTGVCLVSFARGTRRSVSFVDTTSVSFHDLSDEQIDAYVRSGEPSDKAGSYGIQGRGRLLVASIEGDYYNVVGLPIARTMRALEELDSEADRKWTIARLLGGVA
jgi:septum formation protein